MTLTSQSPSLAHVARGSRSNACKGHGASSWSQFLIGRLRRYNPDVAQEPLGLIAGEGIFPLLVARGARAAGRTVICAALAGCAWPELQGECSLFRSVGITRISQWIRVLKAQGCREAIMVGRVQKTKMYSRWRYLQYIPDARTARLWFSTLRHDKSAGAVLRALSDELAQEGITLIDSTKYCTEHLATAGVMTKRQPTDKQWQDIRFGWELCRTVSKLDIGQAIAVLDKDVIAVEALEGTNAMIDRAGVLCKSGGWTLIKVANSNADMRVDVPSIGTTTLEKLHSAGAACVVLEPGKTIILEKQKVLELADRYKIAIVGFEG
jgi:UDP-2,3-diacylglucosamine hydrolase